MKKRVFEGGVDYVQILDKDGKVDEELEPKIAGDTLKKMYYHMVLQRKWDRKNMALQRTGRIFTYAPCEGQEGVQIGAMMATEAQDWVFPTYRESYLYHLRGVPLWKINLTWRGMEDGLKLDPKLRMWPAAIPIGTQLPYGAGAGYTIKMRGEKAAVLVFGGDAATSEGEFHDALNFSGVFETPCVFLISNNGWAISTPRKLQTKAETIAQKALAYGFQGLQIDGNDILAVYKYVKEALERARSGKGPFLIEAITYRMGPHTTADDPKRYRSDDEVAYWRERDPIERFKKYLYRKNLLNEEEEKKIEEETQKIVEEEVKKMEEFKPDPKDIFKYQYGGKFALTKNLEEQMKECFGE